MRPRVFTIPPSAPFLPALLEALAQGRLIPGFSAAGDPLALAGATIYLPTRRACRLARDLVLDVLGGQAALLPRLVAIGDIDEDMFVFADPAAGPAAALALDLPPALGAFERRLLLARLILIWARSPELRGSAQTPLVAHNPASALALADALARLIDDMITRGVAWERLDGLVPDEVDPYWQLTLRFLTIARHAWPAILGERGTIEPAERRDRLIAAEAARLATTPTGPVIAAGSTASMPATAMLLATIARLPHGAVVLPGLDTDLDAPSWDLVAGAAARDEVREQLASVSHPQFAMQAFLAGLGMRRKEVVELAAPAAHGRERLASEALRPAAATERWSERLADPVLDAALRGLAVMESANAEEEALAIAIVLRETAENSGRTAALVTPDRALARRVKAALARWNVPVEDSGGEALADTAAGVFARLSAEAALAGLEPVTLLALLKHPLLRLGAPPGEHLRAASVLERALLRGPRPRPGSAGLVHALATFRTSKEDLHRGDPRQNLTDRGLDAAERLALRLGEALAPLEALPSRATTLAELARRHRDTMVALAADRDGELPEADDLVAVLEALSDIADSIAAASFPAEPRDYGEMLQAALADRVAPRPRAAPARIRIYGLLEARLQGVDRIVLGGLVEGTWPPQTQSDPWLSRPMRRALGLDLPERRIGLTAHDFAQALGAPEVFLSRAAKLGGSPTVASRFVQRLRAVCGEARWSTALAEGARYVALARRLDRPERIERILPPAPTPPLAARPRRLSVTEIEHWLRDPYTIYAKHILRLAPLDAVDTPPGARDRGNVIHGAIGDFTKAFAAALPADALAQLVALGKQHFAPLADHPEAAAFWWPRFERVARWFADWESGRRGSVAQIFAEVDGKLDIGTADFPFELRTRADRIERGADGAYAVLDYKTGAPPTAKQVLRGLSPQLTLEAAILRGGGFTDIPAGAALAALAYVRLSGGEPAGELQTVDGKDYEPNGEADKALARLRVVVAKFADVTMPYRSLTHPMWATRYGDYDHLARVREWSLGGGADDNGAGA